MIQRVLSLSVLILVGSPLWADEGRIPIYQPTTISTPGHYVVTRDFATSTTAITISASDVTVDLNGHTISVSGGGPLPALINVSDGVTRITIRGGRLVGGGFTATTTNQIRISIATLDIVGPTTGISISSAEEVAIESCNISDAAATGIDIRAAVSGSGFRGRIVNNSVASSGGAITLTGMKGGEVRGNYVKGALGGSADGLYLSPSQDNNQPCFGNVVEANVFDGGNASGRGVRIETCTSVSVERNHIVDWALAGIEVINGNGSSHHVRIAHNQVTRNGVLNGSGIKVGGDNHTVEDNQSMGNGRFGIEFSSAAGCVYRNNVLKGNALGAIFGMAGNTDGGGNIQ